MSLYSEDFIRRVPPPASIIWLSQNCLRSISREAETLWFPGGFPPVVGKGVCLGNNSSTVSYPRTHTEIVMVRQGSIRESPEDSQVYYVYGTFLNTHRLIKNNLVIAGQVFPFTSVFQIFASYSPGYLQPQRASVQLVLGSDLLYGNAAGILCSLFLNTWYLKDDFCVVLLKRLGGYFCCMYYVLVYTMI